MAKKGRLSSIRTRIPGGASITRYFKKKSKEPTKLKTIKSKPIASKK